MSLLFAGGPRDKPRRAKAGTYKLFSVGVGYTMHEGKDLDELIAMAKRHSGLFGRDYEVHLGSEVVWSTKEGA